MKFSSPIHRKDRHTMLLELIFILKENMYFVFNNMACIAVRNILEANGT